MILQDRDLDILKFINKFGYVSLNHIRDRFKFSQPRVYQILARLFKNDFIDKKRLIAEQSSIYWLKTKGADLIGANRINKVSLQNLEHNLLVIDVYLELLEKKPDLEIKSDRELRQGKGFGYKGHIPDLEIQTEEKNGRKNIAIEVEISRKDKRRLKGIISELEHKNKYLEVHYYCLGSSLSQVKEVTEFKPIFKVFEYLSLRYEGLNDVAKDIAEVAEQVKEDNSKRVKDLEVKANRLESNLKAKDKEIEVLQKKIDKVKRTFESIDFKKATFGSSYSLSGEDLELIRKIIRGC